MQSRLTSSLIPSRANSKLLAPQVWLQLWMEVFFKYHLKWHERGSNDRHIQ